VFQRDNSGRITLARITETAGVGKATVLRQFGDLNGLVEAVLAPRVAAVQDAIQTGNPPLGPGGSPQGRLHTYLNALFDIVLDNRALIRALEHSRPTPTTRTRQASSGSTSSPDACTAHIRRPMPTTWLTRCSPPCAQTSSTTSVPSNT
jgi:AcrR family transcriptional regulator